MINIIIFGTGGNCIDIVDTIIELNKKELQYNIIGFLDDDETRFGKEYNGIKVVGKISDAKKFNGCYFVNGIGSDKNFWRKSEIIKKSGLDNDRFISIIHPTASVSNFSNIGKGTVILQHVTIASSVKIGDHVIILPNSIISHDCHIGDYTCITGGVCISGGVEIEESCYLGTNSSIKQNLKIEKNTLIGMGSVVLQNLRGSKIYTGNPAKFLRDLF